jgi:hypothetical protein
MSAFLPAFPYFVTTVDRTRPFSEFYMDGHSLDVLLHVGFWLAAVGLEIAFYFDIRHHVDQLHVADDPLLHQATIEAYEATSIGSLITLLISSAVVVLGIAYHWMLLCMTREGERGRLHHDKLIPSLAGIVIGGIHASIMFTVIMQIIFLTEDVTPPVAWVGEPRLWAALLAVKWYGSTILSLNLHSQDHEQ